MIVARVMAAILALVTAIADSASHTTAQRAGHLAIGFVGDSITQDIPSGGILPPPDLTARYLSAPGQVVRAVNQGHRGSNTGDWLPRARSGYLPAALNAFARAGVRVVHVMLGTNDANPGAAAFGPAAYRANLQHICHALTEAGYRVVLSYPPYALPNSTAAVRVAMDDSLRAYQAAIDSLVNGKQIMHGDRHAYAYFKSHAWELSDGIHPDPRGVIELARLWAAALRPVIAGQ